MNNRLLQVLKVSPFLFLWLAEVFAQVAMNMVNFVLIILAFELTKSNTAVSGIVLSFTLPAIFFGIIAGALVDRWHKKSVLFLTNIVRVVLLLVLLYMHTNLLWLYALSLLISIVTQFFIPAETPMIPLLVNKKLLYSANALFGLAIYGSVLVAYALSSPLLLLYGKTTVLLMISFMFLIGAFFIMLVKDPEKKSKIGVHVANQKIRATLGVELRTVVSLILKTKAISHSLLLLSMSQILILILAVIGPGYANQVLGIKVDEFPLFFMTPAALGMVLGAILLINVFHGISKKKSVTVGVFLLGFSLLFLPYGSKVTSRVFIQSLNTYLPHIVSITILHIMVFFAFVVGFANALIYVPSNTILQEESSDAIRGKVYGALNAMVGVFSFFPIIIVGGLADLIGVGKVLTGIGIVVIFIGLLRVILLRKDA